jgi:hypothetical protein
MKDDITGFMHEPPDKQPAVVACRIAGPGDGDRIPFVKHIKLLK